MSAPALARKPDARKLKPTGFKPNYLRECIDVLAADPPLLRWRARPRSHFPAGKNGDLAFNNWRKTLAGQTIRPTDDGRLRLSLIRDGERVKLDARAVIAEIGVTPLKDRFGPDGSAGPAGPNDRLAEEREIAGSGPLARTIQFAKIATGAPLADLTVMDIDCDPYRMDTPAKRRDAQWFADLVARFVDPDKKIHARGIYYACLGAGDVRLPNGDSFTGTKENAAFVTDAGGLARWLGYVPFEGIVDQKNAPPIVREAPPTDDPTANVWANDLDIGELDADNIGVFASLTDFEPRHPYRLVFFGEKTSLDDVLGPLAVEFSADLYLTGGQISDTLMHHMASVGAEDGRPLVVLTFSDFDPAGYWDMPTTIGRKLQGLRDLLFPDLKFTVVHAALGPDQVRRLGLPDSPLKEGEKRGEIWLELYGSEQTEIDALATLNPAELERIARAAVAPYFDATLARRVAQAERTWRNRVDAEVAGQVDEGRIDELKEIAEAGLRSIREVNAELADMAERIRIVAPPDLPAPDMEALEEAQDERSDAVLIDSEMDFVEATGTAERPQRTGSAKRTAAMMTPEAKRAEAREIAAMVRAERQAGFPALGAYTPHRVCDIVRWMTDDEFVGLIWSIKRSGLIDPIVVDGDVIIDGRCRLVACRLAGVEPRFKPFQYDGAPEGKEEDIEHYFFSVNFMRGNLNQSQRLVIEAQIVADRPDLADHFHDLSDEALMIARHPDIADRVKRFYLPLAEAYHETLERDAEAAKRAEERQRLEQLRLEAPFVAAIVDEGKLTVDQGVALAEEAAAAPLLDEHVQAIRALGRRMMADALEIGRRLVECRRYVHSDWEGWLKRELGLEYRTALNFIRIHELAASRTENFSEIDLPVSGLYLLARPSTPEAVRDDVLGRAAAGETISFAEIKREVSGETPTAAPVEGLAKLAAQLAEERPDDPLIEQLQALVLALGESQV